jgi:hypothetical protein
MTAGRHPKLTYPALRIIDGWYAQTARHRKPSAKALAARLGCSYGTILDAALRRRGYRDCP